jgi:6-pyruvoyltetrahydropterin/6-carboxytetrahydropterin synthase
VFGRCYNPPAHGHNYLLEVTVSGEIDQKTGMVVNLFDLKRVLLDVIEEFDHKNLNLDIPYFKDRIPTSENFAHVLWTKLAAQRDIGTLHTLRLCEDEDLYAEVTASDGPGVASVTRRYTFNAVQESHEGRDWDCYVTVHGKIDPVTGMVTDIGALDRLVEDKVIKKFDRQDLRQALGAEKVRGEALVKTIWDRLVGHLPCGTLYNIRLVQTRDLSFDYAGQADQAS